MYKKNTIIKVFIKILINVIYIYQYKLDRLYSYSDSSRQLKSIGIYKQLF